MKWVPSQLRNNAGITLVEMLVALGVLGIVLLVGHSNLITSIRMATNARANITDAIVVDTSLRGLAGQLARSQIDRAGVAQCNGLTLLRAGETSRPLQSLSEAQQSLSFAFSEKTFLAATDIEVPSSIRTADASGLKPGQVLYLSALEGQKLAGLFTVSDIDLRRNSVRLSPGGGGVPHSLGCTFNASRFGSSEMLNRLKSRKFAVDVVSLVSYQKTAEGQRASLQRILWNGRTAIASTSTIVTSFVKLDILQRFLSSNSSSGEYHVAATVHFGEGTPKLRRQIDSGYRLMGLDITNSKAIPEPPIVGDLFVTCSVTANLIKDRFQREGTNDFMSLYEIKANYSEVDALSGGRTPTITAVLTNQSVSTSPTYCWQADDIKPVSNTNLAPQLPWPGSGPSFGFFPTQFTSTGSGNGGGGSADDLVRPVYCYVPANSMITGKLKYVDSSGSRMREVTCSPTVVEGTESVTWSYDRGQRTKCSEDGLVSFGSLVDEQTGRRSGPRLYLGTDSCEWSGTSYSGCSLSEALKRSPSTKLRSIKLYPSHIEIQNGSLSVACND